MNFYEVFWPIWLIFFIAVPFAIVETLAIIKEKKNGEVDTFTSWVQSRTKSDWIKDIVAAIIIGVPIWFVFHLWI